MGLSVTGTYAMQALGHFRTVAYISLAGKAAMLLVMIELMHRMGLQGLALSRLCYGSVALLVYLPLLRLLTTGRERGKRVSPLAIPLEAQEGSQRMKILIAAASYSSSISGIERHALNLVRCLLLRPEISALHLVVAPWQLDLAQTAGLPADVRLNIHIADMNRSSLSRNLWYFRRLPQVAAQLQVDLVHLSFPMPCDATAFNCPTVLTLHDLYPYEIPMNFGFPKFVFNRIALRQCLHSVDKSPASQTRRAFD